VPLRSPPDGGDAAAGYISNRKYKIVDQYNRVLPHPVPVNEHFVAPPNWQIPPLGSGAINDTASNWIRGAEKGAVVDPSSLFDTISGCLQGWDLGNGFGACQPVPRAPPASGPLSRRKIHHWCGDIYVGSSETWTPGGTNSGKGVRVATLVWQRFLDHARHCDVYSPPTAGVHERLFPCAQEPVTCF
jgi:hypothetical protein